MFAKQKERVATRAIIVKDGKVLLGKRARGYGINQFALIGGRPEEKETLEQTIGREVKEETGLNFNNPILWKETPYSDFVPKETWHIYFFIGQTEGRLKLKKDEVLETLYVGKSDLDEVDIAFNHKEILKEFFEENV